MRTIISIFILITLAFLAAHFTDRPDAAASDRPTPAPGPGPVPKPRRPRIETITVGGPTSPDGTEVQVDLPVDQRKKNIASKGLGCCVFRSAEHAARWQNVPQLWGMPEWMVQQGIPGGGYPEKLQQLCERICRERKLPMVQLLQYEGRDPAIIQAALATGRMPCITYEGRDPHYRGTIAHMVNAVYLDDGAACILDNNFVGENELVWMTRAEFVSRWLGSGGGWAAILLEPPPPPPPHN